MDKNYYHVQLAKDDQFSYETPSAEGRKIEVIGSANVTRMSFANGEELLQVINGDRIDIYASFPIKIEYR